MRGQACVRDLRFPVSSVVAMVADGMTTAEITADHPDLEPEDIVECLRYAAVAVQQRGLPLRQYGLLGDLLVVIPVIETRGSGYSGDR